jgi:hypothetical protein
MIMNTHAIPSRMTIGHVIEMVIGKVAANLGAIADGTAFTDDGRLTKQLNSALEQLGFEKFGNEILYDGTSGKQLQTDIFIGPIFSMRLKHMVEDKWNARGKGRREQRTHQPTGGRGAQGGLRIGEMERDAILGHGISAFVNESYMLRSDGVSFRICKGCGTIPIENPKTGLFVCPLCTGPVAYIGSGPNDLELIPPIRKTMVAPVVIEMPYAFKLLSQELETYMNIGMRIMTEKDLLRLTGINKDELPPLTDEERRIASTLHERVLPEASVPEFRELVEGPTEASPELLMKLGIRTPGAPVVSDEDTVVVNGTGVQGSIKAAADVALRSGTPGIVSGSMVQTSNGQVFQPNPTTVTVVPPAVNVGIQKTVQAIGPPEALVADEELGAIPQVLPQAQPQVQPQAIMPQGPPMQQGGYMMPQLMPQAIMPQSYPGAYYPMNPGINMGPGPNIYATSVPQPAQLYTSGVPGVPPTFSVQTDLPQMGGFINSGSVRPMRNNTTAKKRVGFNESHNQQGSGTASPDMKITVIKGT